jgi:hypothetical protein
MAPDPDLMTSPAPSDPDRRVNSIGFLDRNSGLTASRLLLIGAREHVFRPKPFTGTADPDAIIEKVRRGKSAPNDFGVAR